ncbi:hypothetical protein OIV83_004235 [Microbotryomycetes sp. JL201]|nr:hypothetical protein OIV83_004235 [Microbotryomycetes sp. JL201]
MTQNGSGQSDDRKGSSAGALTATADKQKSNRNGNRCKAKGNCHNCGKTGHWRSECRAPKKDGAKLTEEVISLAVIEEITDSASEIAFMSQAQTSKWIIDPGASRQSTGNRSHLKSLSNRQPTSRSRTSNGPGYGPVGFVSAKGQNFELKKVYLLPGATVGLVLVGNLEANGSSTERINKRINKRWEIGRAGGTVFTTNKGLMEVDNEKSGVDICSNHPSSIS